MEEYDIGAQQVYAFIDTRKMIVDADLQHYVDSGVTV
jgi:hypothetical protein